MATYIQCKAGAFRKIEDSEKSLKNKRSEGRLKRYTSVTDTRSWVNNVWENKAFIFNFMGQEPVIKKRKIIGQIIPIDMIWKLLLSNKNNYIHDLEDKIDAFAKLLQKINLSKSQIAKIKNLCASSFCSINSYLVKHKLTEYLRSDIAVEKCIQACPRLNDNEAEKSMQASPRVSNNEAEKGVQAAPQMLTTTMEAKALTNNVALKTLPVDVCDSSTTADAKQMMNVGLQVVLTPCVMADKSVSVRVRSSSTLMKSLKEQSTEVSERQFEIATMKSTPVMVNKAQSGDVFTRHVAGDAMDPEWMPMKRNSYATFGTTSCRQLQQGERAFESDDTINPAELIEDFVSLRRSDASGETIEVISECEQTSLSELQNAVRSSVIQLYCSTQRSSSIESTFMQPTSDQVLGDEAPSNADTVASEVTVAPGARLELDLNEKMSLCVVACTDRNESDDDDFQDCQVSFAQGDRKNQETYAATCVNRKPSPASCRDCFERLKFAEAELAKHKSIAIRALQQLDLIRQTLHDNDITIADIDIPKIVDILSPNQYQDMMILESCLAQACRHKVEPYIILNEQFQLVEAYWNSIKVAKLPAVLEPMLKFAHSKVVDIASSGDGRGTMKLVKQVEYYKNQVAVLEQITLECKKLQQTVTVLENELRVYRSLKYEFVLDPEVAELLDANDILQEICSLKTQAEIGAHLERELACEKKCVENLKESLANLSAARNREFDTLRQKAQEADVLRLEMDSLRIQFTGMQKLKADNVNLQNKCAEIQRAAKVTQVSRSVLEKDFQLSKDLTAEVETLRSEKQALLGTLVIKECEIVEQEDQIERLVTHVERLTINYEELQAKSKQIVSQLRCDLSVKEKSITKLDNNLKWVEEKLKQSISTISKDSSELQNKVIQLERTCMHYKAKNDSMQDTVNGLRTQLEKQEGLNKTYLLELQKKNTLVEGLLERNADGDASPQMKNVTRMESILKKSHNAVRKVVEELAKQYRCDFKEIQDVMPELIQNS